jgi:transcriptional antiterminator RfaH
MEYLNREDEEPQRRRWYVLHVKPRTEKKTFEYLERHRLWRYLPLYRKIVRRQRRKVVSVLPIFPGYVFSRLNADERIVALKSNFIVRTIAVPDPREMIHQLRQIRKAERSGEEIRTVERFTEGELVRIKSGHFRGMEGRIKHDNGGLTIVLNIDILGQAVALHISPSECEKIQ